MRNNTILIFSIIATSVLSCQHAKDGGSDTTGHVTEGYSALWPNGVIEVCWESHASSEEDRTLVKNAVVEQFNGRTVVQFSGWDLCAPASKGARIQVADERPHVKAFGAFLDGMANGVVLNFTFKQWPYQACSHTEERRKACIRDYALHEFGHVLGLRHEANRTDSTCHQDQFGGKGEAGAIPVDAYDKRSIMNYCWNQANIVGEIRSELSPGDLLTIKKYYNRQVTFDGPDKAVECEEDGGTWKSIDHCCSKPALPRPNAAYQVCPLPEAICTQNGGDWKTDKQCCALFPIPPGAPAEWLSVICPTGP